ncbi:unnamed protein product [Microthlaspi erraticum]|uniref:Uncharacterized protein n=1 Tax=Microthlaspi erraticum TaxID=1685480 RepID=A0A6D2I722_9BRAS|nr:unnamed protein product [Microthlaspi erraticum]
MKKLESDEIELRKKLIEKEMELQYVTWKNERLTSGMELEKMECDQWKKAEEAAASMLSDSGGDTSNNCEGKYVENTMELQSVMRQNESLRSEIEKMKSEKKN